MPIHIAGVLIATGGLFNIAASSFQKKKADVVQVDALMILQWKSLNLPNQFSSWPVLTSFVTEHTWLSEKRSSGHIRLYLDDVHDFVKRARIKVKVGLI